MTAPPTTSEPNSERLREIILDLEQSRAREAALRQQSDALLAGLEALVGSDDVSEAFRKLLDVFAEALDFDDAFVLDASGETGDLRFVLSNHAEFEGATLRRTGAVARSCEGRTVILTDVSELEEWAHLPSACAGRARAAIMAPLAGRNRRALLVGVKAEPGYFTKRHRRLMDRMAPLARQALIALEQRERLADSFNRIRAIFDGAPYCILTIEDDLRIGPKFSASAVDMLKRAPEEIHGGSATELLTEALRLEGDVAARLRDTLAATIGDGALTWELNADHLPSEATLDEPTPRVIDLIWSPMIDEEADLVRSVVLSMRDVTHERALAAEIEAKSREHDETIAALDVLLRAPRDRLAAFFAETDMRLEWLSGALGATGAPADRLLGELHTVKGGARLLGFSEIASALHALEERLQGVDLDAAEVLAAPERCELWYRAEGAYERLRQVFRSVMGGDGAMAAATVSGLCEAPLADARRALAEAGVACETTLRDGVGPLEPALASAFGTVLQHVIANMVDHSILPGRARDGGATARLSIAARSIGPAAESIEIVLEDDGLGFDLEKIRARAAARGLVPPAATPLSVIFEAGFSTADAATERSGRGVGMTAVRDAARAVGGEIALGWSAEGGSRIAVQAPRSTGRRIAAAS